MACKKIEFTYFGRLSYGHPQQNLSVSQHSCRTIGRIGHCLALACVPMTAKAPLKPRPSDAKYDVPYQRSSNVAAMRFPCSIALTAVS